VGAQAAEAVTGPLISPTHVFTCQGKPITRMMTSSWKRARMRIELNPPFRLPLGASQLHLGTWAKQRRECISAPFDLCTRLFPTGC
jgi:hypothetical protein